MLCQRTKQVKNIALDVDILLTTKGLKNKMDSLKETGLEPVINRLLCYFCLISIHTLETGAYVVAVKGQLISKGLFGVIVSTKKSTNFFLGFLL